MSFLGCRSNKLGLAQGIVVLPEHLGLLTNLRVLDLAENLLTTLPIEVRLCVEDMALWNTCHVHHRALRLKGVTTCAI